MDDLMKRLREKLHRHRVTEGDVIPFPDRKKDTVTQKVKYLADELPIAFELQARTEKAVVEQVKQLTEHGESSKKKFYVPFIMKEYQEGTNPIQALIWQLEEYLEYGETEKNYSKTQMQYAYQFLNTNLNEMLSAVQTDLAAADILWKETLKLDIPLPGYAAKPIASFIRDLQDTERKLQDFRMYDGIFAHPERTWSSRQTEHRNALLNEDTTIGDTPFKRETGMPFYDEMLEKPSYFEEAKGIIWMIQDMSPDEYIRRCIEGFKQHQSYSGDIFRAKDKARAEKYARLMLAGEKFPMLTLNYIRLDFTQEGFHRAWAAKLAGYDTVPVMVIDNTAEEKKALRQRYGR